MKQKQPDIAALFNQLQAQFVALDRKVDILVSRSLSSVVQQQSAPKPPVNNAPLQNKPNNHNPPRAMHQAICADCKKPCSVPFKPTGDRPIYCQDCFSKRKVISMSKMGTPNAAQQAPAAASPVVSKPVDAPKTKAKAKKAAPTKKPVAKKKTTAKKK
jgi:CxxC-x17-CxxC domain-containing protein